MFDDQVELQGMFDHCLGIIIARDYLKHKDDVPSIEEFTTIITVIIIIIIFSAPHNNVKSSKFSLSH